MILALAVNKILCYDQVMTSDAAADGDADRPPINRRARRRQETIEEILSIAERLMGEHGVNGLALSEVARRLGVKPPSIYKYFDSLLDIYDALFQRGQQANLDVMLAAEAEAEPGMDTLVAMLEANARWCLANPALAQLMFWRPVPNFEPTPQAMAPSVEMVRLQRRALADAAANGQLGPEADSDEAVFLVSIIISGVLGQAMANEPGVPWGGGRFTPLFPKLMGSLTTLYPPTRKRR